MPFQRDFTLGRYYPGSSLLHRLDPRTKLCCSLLLMTAVFLVTQVLGMIFFLAVVLVLHALGRLPVALFGRNIRAFLWLYLITFLLHLFLHPGRELFSIPILEWAATWEGLAAGILFSLRIAVLVSVSNLLLAITTPQELADGLERIFRPLHRFGLPVGEGALMVSITLRFVPILWEEGEKIRCAQAARGADLEGALWRRLHRSLPLIIPLFASALKRADDLALALQARGYHGHEHRTQLVILKFSGIDVAAVVVTFSLVLTFGLLR